MYSIPVDDVVRLRHMLDAAHKTGTRNHLIHGYFNVDLDIVWNIIQNDLPPCIAALENVVSTASDE